MKELKVTISTKDLEIDLNNKINSLDQKLDKILQLLEQTPPETKQPIADKQKPPVNQKPYENKVFDLEKILTSATGVLRLPVEFDNKEIVVKCSEKVVPTCQGIIGNNTILTFESWDKTPDQLIDCNTLSSFFIRGITFVCPPNRPIKTAFPDKEIFGWGRNTVKQGKFAYIDGKEILDKERVTFGLSRFAYSSEGNKMIFLIAENISHNGFNFTQLKNPYSGNLFLHLKNVNIYNPIIEQPQSHYYTPTRILVRIKVENGIATIISDNTYDQILTWVGYNNGNQRSILHFDRYAYDISEDRLIDNKNLRIDYPDEYHPLDNIQGLGKVLRKQIYETRNSNWQYTYEPNNLPTSIALPVGEFDAYIVYKGNALFSPPAIDKDSSFGPGYWQSGIITQSQGFGWSWYNEEFSGYIENFNGTGYFRNSGGSGVTQGLTIKNSTFELNPPLATANENNTHSEVIAYLNQIRSIAL